MKKITSIVLISLMFIALSPIVSTASWLSGQIKREVIKTVNELSHRYKIKGRIVMRSELSATGYEGMSNAEICVIGTNICTLSNVGGGYILYVPKNTYRLTAKSNPDWRTKFKKKTIYPPINTNTDKEGVLITIMERIND